MSLLIANLLRWLLLLPLWLNDAWALNVRSRSDLRVYSIWWSLLWPRGWKRKWFILRWTSSWKHWSSSNLIIRSLWRLPVLLLLIQRSLGWLYSDMSKRILSVCWLHLHLINVGVRPGSSRRQVSLVWALFLASNFIQVPLIEIPTVILVISIWVIL